MSVIFYLLLLLGIVLVAATLPLLLELLVLSIAALLQRPRTRPERLAKSPMPITVLIPAHNEEALIGRCVQSIRSAADRATKILVIAHNCTDSTALEAKAAGANVLVLNDPGQVGKGSALSYGFNSLRASNSLAALVIDADSVIDPGLITAVRERMQAGAKALQCRYEVHNSQDSRRTRLMTLAFCGVNVIRPLGRDRLGLSAGILGNGFAIHRDVLMEIPYNAHSVVEDLEFHLSLVRAGTRVEFIDNAAVRGEMPVSAKGARAQRARWEGGRIRMMKRWAPYLFRNALSGRLRQIEPLLDLLALPLATEVVLLVISACVPFLWMRIYTMVAFAILFLHIVAIAIKGPGLSATMKTLVAVPGYILWKLWVFPEIWRNSRLNAEWVRTHRETTASVH